MQSQTSQHNFRLKDGRTYTLTELEQAGLSYVPCYPQQPIFPYAAIRRRGTQVTLDDYRQQAKNAWTLAQWQSRQERGVQIFTGKTSTRIRDGQIHYLTDFDIEKLFIDTYPQAYQQILSIYRNNAEHAEPVETKTKSEGKRLSAYTPARSKKISFTNQDGDMILEFFSEDGLSRYDNRYTIESGCLLDIPLLSVSAAREIYAIAKEVGIENKAKHSITDTVEVDNAGFPEDITYNTDGISPYYPIKFCAVTQHKKHPETAGKVQYFKDIHGGEKGHCYDCGEWWWKTKPIHKYTPKLKITGTNETYTTLAENEQAIMETFSDVMTATHSDKPRYLILTFEMGTGKNEAFLMSLATFKKKGILISENHKQVDQNVTRGEIHGLRSRGLRGRSYRFDESPLSAILPKIRQQSPHYFEKYNVVCLFYDQIMLWNLKGLASNAYCQVCPLKNNCPYLQQFHGLSEIDLLSISFADLFFDPGLWNFLYRLTKGETETFEEEIIGDVLGLDTKTESKFELGVVDEATAINLYQGYQYQIDTLEKVANAWDGELLADTMNNIIQALETQDPHTAMQTLLDTLDNDMEKQISEQMTQVPIPVDVIPHILRDKETDNILSEYLVKPAGTAEDYYENELHIPVSRQAEEILRHKLVPTISYQPNLPSTKIGVSPYAELKKGTLRLSDIAGRVWQHGWTLIDQLKKSIRIDIEKIGIRYTPRGEEINMDTVTITVPPQVNPFIPNLVFMGGHTDAENIINAFDEKENIIWKVTEGKQAAYATGVQTLQMLDTRLTYRTVFEVEKDTETGKTVYDTDTASPKVIGITQFGMKLLTHLCNLAERHIADGHSKPVFISWKEFTVSPIADTEIGKRMHACLEIGHFDNTRGLNYEERKVFLKFGYPKARHDVIKRKAEILHHNDPEPLDDTYEKINEIEDGYQTIGTHRYKDPRMEAQRQQEIRNKAEQTVYRSRPTRWENTTTIDFSAEPIPGWTARATGFILTDFLRSESFENIGTMVAEREALTAENTIEDFKRIYMCSERQARNLWEAAGGKELKDSTENNLVKRILERHNQGMSNLAIANVLDIHESKVRRVIRKNNK